MRVKYSKEAYFSKLKEELEYAPGEVKQSFNNIVNYFTDKEEARRVKLTVKNVDLTLILNEDGTSEVEVKGKTYKVKGKDHKMKDLEDVITKTLKDNKLIK